jgi:hypothetical protein
MDVAIPEDSHGFPIRQPKKANYTESIQRVLSV